MRDVVDVDISSLLCIDVMDEHSLVAETASNQVLKKTVARNDVSKSFYTLDDWKLPLIREKQHV